MGVLGSINLDVVVTADRLPAPGETVHGHSVDEYAGGKGLNQAVAAARSGADVRFFGAVGDDEAGRRLRSLMHVEQIDATAVGEVDAATGRAIVAVDASGENSIVVVAGANAHVPPPGDLSGVLLAQLEVDVDLVTDTFVRSSSAWRILNPAPSVPLPPALVSSCDVIVPNEHELVSLGGASALLDGGCDTVIVTRGAAGADIIDHHGTSHLPPFEVSPLDTTGAGDAFCGSFAARIAAGDDIASAARWACAAGALATTVRGAVPSQPHAADIELLLLVP